MKITAGSLLGFVTNGILMLAFSGCTYDTGGMFGSDNRTKLNAAADSGLLQLYATTPVAKELGKKAVAILIFPDVLKGGFMLGGETGNGVLLEHTRTTGYYNMSAASYGLQAGVQTFGYAMFFMDESALNYLRRSGGWQVGVGPSIVFVDQGTAKTMDTTTIQSGIYAFVYGQTGLMGGLGLEGSKITKLQQ